MNKTHKMNLRSPGRSRKRVKLTRTQIYLDWEALSFQTFLSLGQYSSMTGVRMLASLKMAKGSVLENALTQMARATSGSE